MRQNAKAVTPAPSRTWILNAVYVDGCEVWPSQEVDEIQLYSLGLAQNECGVALHSFDCRPQGVSVSFTERNGNAQQFVNRLMELMDVGLSSLLGREDSIWRGPVVLEPPGAGWGF